MCEGIPAVAALTFSGEHILNAMWLKAYVVAFVSLLSGAAVVHNIYKPDLVGC